MKLIILSLFCIINLYVFGQIEEFENEEEIEIVSEPQFDYPNFVSDSSLSNLDCLKNGIELIRITPSPCQGDVMRDTTFVGIVNSNYQNDTITVKVSLIEACCRSFIGEIELKNDSTLSLNYTVYGDECFCSCCYQMTYKIYCVKNSINSFILNNEENYLQYRGKKTGANTK